MRTLALTEGKQSEGKRIAERSDGKIIKAIAIAMAMAENGGKICVCRGKGVFLGRKWM